MAISLTLALTLSGAHAGTLATTFGDDAGGWTGGSVAAGVLTTRDSEVALAPGPMRSFHLATRVRLVEGTRMWFAAGDATLVAAYTEGGGLTLGASAAPLPLGEQAWTADAATTLDGRAPDVLRWGAEWLLYREEGGAVVAARSSDGVTWTELGAVVSGGAPEAVAEADGVALYYACADRNAVCRATSTDGVTFGAGTSVLTTAATPEVTVSALDTGGWRMWIDDGAGVTSALSVDGRTWRAEGAVAGPARLQELDAVAFSGGLAAAWVGADGVYGTDAVADTSLSASTGDRGPLVAAGFAAWGAEPTVAPALALLGPTWHLWVETTDARVGHLVGVPAPGAWVGLVVDWDGATLTATWGTGATLATPLDTVDAVRIGALGALEMDEAQLSYTLDAADTGDTGADTASDTGHDTAGTADTAATDTAETGADTDTAAPTDTAPTDTALPDTAPRTLWGAAALSGEPGGCGCTFVSEGPRSLAFLALVGLLAVRRRT